MDKLQILQVNKLYYPVTGGIEKIVQQLAEGLEEETEMRVLVCRQKGRTVRDTISGVPVYRAGSFGVFKSVPLSLAFFPAFYRMSEKADIVQFHMPFPLGDLACLLSGYKGKVVVWWHSDIVKQKVLMKFYMPVMEAFLKRADMILVATEGNIDSSAYLPKYREKCRVVPFGVDRGVLKSADLYLDRQDRAEDTEARELSYLFIGRLVYYKGCNVLMEALAKTDQGTLTMVGDGPLAGELKTLAKTLGIEHRVSFLGALSQERLEQELGACDVFVLPSVAKSEAFGIVQIEAMAYGKPVINTKLPSGVPYVSRNMETGLTVKPNDAIALAQAMIYMQEHPEERRRMGQEAAKRSREKFSETVMLQKTMECYREVLGIETIEAGKKTY